jgi:hypothetical protein
VTVFWSGEYPGIFRTARPWSLHADHLDLLPTTDNIRQPLSGQQFGECDQGGGGLLEQVRHTSGAQCLDDADKITSIR